MYEKTQYNYGVLRGRICPSTRAPQGFWNHVLTCLTRKNVVTIGTASIILPLELAEQQISSREKVKPIKMRDSSKNSSSFARETRLNAVSKRLMQHFLRSWTPRRSFSDWETVGYLTFQVKNGDTFTLLLLCGEASSGAQYWRLKHAVKPIVGQAPAHYYIQILLCFALPFLSLLYISS